MSLSAQILVVEDDPAQREQLAGFLRDLGADVIEAGDGEAALDLVRAGANPDVVLSDVRMPRLAGPELLRRIKALNPTIEIVLVTAFAAVPEAVGCLKDGASDYLVKPLDLDALEHVVSRAIEARRLRRENEDLRRRLSAMDSLPGVVSDDPTMQSVLSTIARAASTTVSVLLFGESGTGKELLARALHAAGPRRDGPFVAVNAAALPSSLLEAELFGHERGAFTGADRARTGRLEAAHGGTLFLDEIGEMPPAAQVKLLRVLQERTVERVGSNRPVPVDVRVVAATNRDLQAEIAAGRFREDLYYRLAVVPVTVPPLRARRVDVPRLVAHFLAKHAALAGGRVRAVSREAMDTLLRYDFPGNVRELENVVERAIVLARGELVTQQDLPEPLRVAAARAEGVASTLPERVALVERRAIEEALQAERGNQSRAAARLGISERALRYKLAKLREDGRVPAGGRADADE